MTTPDLHFDHAKDADGAPAGPQCGLCGAAVAGEYWKLQAKVLCAGCRLGVLAALSKSRSASSFGRAALLGGGTALGCGIAYAIFVGITDIQFALITIGIAYLIAKVVRKASAGLSGRKFQILAVALTYVASSLGYFPGVWQAIRSNASDPPAAHAAASSGAGSDKAAPGDRAAPGDKSAPGDAAPVTAPPAKAPPEPLSVGKLILGLGMIFALVLAMPILSATDAPIGLIIVLIGLWEAWKLSRPVVVAVEGPFRVQAAATGPPE
jgi:hypothetical protein